MMDQPGPADRGKDSRAAAGTGLSSTALGQLGAKCKHVVACSSRSSTYLGPQARAAVLLCRCGRLVKTAHLTCICCAGREEAAAAQI